MDKDLKPFYNVGPGDIIQDGLDALGWTQEDLADVTGLNQKSINQIINHKQTITIDTAQLLARVFETTPEVWLNLDAAYQLRKHQESPREKLTEKKSKLRRLMPLAEMRKKGWFIYDDSIEGLSLDCERIFGTKDVGDDQFTEQKKFCARQSKVDEEWTTLYSTAWFQVARVKASELELPPFNKEGFITLCQNIKKYTLLPDGPELFIREMKNLGVGFLVLSHLQKTYLDGAAFFLDANPIVIYTGRYNRVDNFWYTLSHEVAHVILHLKPGSAPILDNLDGIGESEIERQADEYATQLLSINEVVKAGMAYGKYLSAERLNVLSNQFQMSISLIVGILQHAHIVEWRQFTRYRESVLDRIPSEFIKG